MNPSSPGPTGQRLFGSVLILLAALLVLGVLKNLAEQSPGKSRIDWPHPSSVKP